MPGRSERITDSIVGTIATIGGIAVAVVAYNHPYESKKLLTIVTGEEYTTVVEEPIHIDGQDLPKELENGVTLTGVEQGRNDHSIVYHLTMPDSYSVLTTTEIKQMMMNIVGLACHDREGNALVAQGITVVFQANIPRSGGGFSPYTYNISPSNCR